MSDFISVVLLEKPRTIALHQMQHEKHLYGAPFVKILYLTDLAQKLLSLAEIAISACRDVISGRDSYLCRQRCYLWQRQLSLHAGMLSLADIAISACRDVISGRDSYLCMQR